MIDKTVTLANTIESVIAAVTAWFSQTIIWVGDLVEVIVTEPLLLIMCCLLPLTGFVIGYVRRLIRL